VLWGLHRLWTPHSVNTSEFSCLGLQVGLSGLGVEGDRVRVSRKPDEGAPASDPHRDALRLAQVRWEL
jgi:hypothetical protein